MEKEAECFTLPHPYLMGFYSVAQKDSTCATDSLWSMMARVDK